MKRIFALLLSLLMVISFAACGKDNTTSDTNNGASNSNANSETGAQTDDVDVDLDGYAELVVKGNVDPRVKARGWAVRIVFCNLETGDEEIAYLYDTFDYKCTIKINKGYYATLKAFVVEDVYREYDVEFINFMAEDSKTEVEVTVGDPNYKGDTID